MMKTVNQVKKYSTDWLSSQPVFYNIRTNRISKNINDVIDFNNLEFDPEGLNNYLEFGYSVFGRTPVKNVFFLDHSSEIYVNNNKLIIEKRADVSESLVSSIYTNESDVIEQIISTVRNWEKKQTGPIIIPTSGGFDSRLLNFAILNKMNIHSFTYGITDLQSDSHEVVFANELSKTLKTNWHQIKLGNFHNHFNYWNDLYGPSTHAHGMYQIEFYKNIRNSMPDSNNPLLSGIIGDAWASRNKISEIKSIDQLINLGYTHGLHADQHASLLKSSNISKQTFFEKIKDKIDDERFRTIEAMRMKLMLLNYLFIIPESFQFKPWSPFLLPKIASMMLNISPSRRENRQWQKDFFIKNNLYFENRKLSKNMINSLDKYAIRHYPLKPLSVSLLREIINPIYIKWINDNLNNHNLNYELTSFFLKQKIFNFVLPMIGINDTKVIAYNAYLTIIPLQSLLEKGRINTKRSH